jgi:hypothetical protein
MPGESRPLKDMAEHVAYQAFMLAGTTQLIEKDFPPPSRVKEGVRDVVRNALLESSLVHVRVLDDFLSMYAPGRPDDVVAIDFLTLWKPRTCLTRDERDYVNKRLMHLRTVRGEGPAPWQLEKARELMNNFREFLQALDTHDPAKAEWFRPYVEREGSTGP